tara:strand:- start:68 stop:445 length:378 start_codon:yes stop_codon:yes gene_type:complete
MEDQPPVEDPDSEVKRILALYRDRDSDAGYDMAIDQYAADSARLAEDGGTPEPLDFLDHYGNPSEDGTLEGMADLAHLPPEARADIVASMREDSSIKNVDKGGGRTGILGYIVNAYRSFLGMFGR